MKYRRSLAYTWGFPMSAVGALAATALRIARPWLHLLFGVEITVTRFGGRLCFLLGQGWGGLTLGHVMFCQRDASEALLRHEWGHTVQNIRFGPLMLPLTLASAARYHARLWRARRGEALPPYDAWWFEAQATRLGAFAPVEGCGKGGETP